MMNKILHISYKMINTSSKLLLDYTRKSPTKYYGDRVFATAAPTLWNNLPFTVRSFTNCDSLQDAAKNSFIFCEIPASLIHVFFGWNCVDAGHLDSDFLSVFLACFCYYVLTCMTYVMYILVLRILSLLSRINFCSVRF